jgi:hypothetical protein
MTAAADDLRAFVLASLRFVGIDTGRPFITCPWIEKREEITADPSYKNTNNLDLERRGVVGPIFVGYTVREIPKIFRLGAWSYLRLLRE